ncbi:hypothetical protein GCM10009700_27880 [Brevibacterium sanguinis]|uniref:hypothetical protein n=1 Tax=Brevibacterium sanguinis TaxID=232444 RepID=UPI0031D978AC
MSNDNLGASGLIAGAVAAVSIVAGITVGAVNSRLASEREFTTCVESGGTYHEGTQSLCVEPGYMNPEGIITFHSASGQVYKTLIENDELPKGAAA